MTPDDELIALGQELKSAANPPELEAAEAAIEAIRAAVDEVGRSFSGSWLGYHSRVYYAGLEPAPPGAHFSQEWGLMDAFAMGSEGDWREFDTEFVKSFIYRQAGNPDLGPLRQAAQRADDVFRRCKPEIISIISTEIERRTDAFLQKLQQEIEELELASPFDATRQWQPRGGVMTRDTTALGQRNQVPPHIEVRAEVVSLIHSFGACTRAAEICTRAASHIRRKTGRQQQQARRDGNKVFIGHGRSPCWRELKDFIADRLNLPWDEFNRVPIAGVTTIARLSDMLDNAAMAFLVMTAEDELADGEMQARMNVIHEAGLFQGKLGFTKAIVLVEDGCKEFTNIQGLGQIRFPKGRVDAVFEQVRAVLEREGLTG